MYLNNGYKVLEGGLILGERKYHIHDYINGGRIAFIGQCLQESTAVIEYIVDDESSIDIVTNSNIYNFKKYDRNKLEQLASPPSKLYLGFDRQEVLDSGRDILGEKILAEGNLSYENIKGILPPITKDAYSFLGNTSCWSGVTIDLYGNIYPQLNGANIKPSSIFSPVEIDDELGDIKPFQLYLNGFIPILVSLHKGIENSMEIISFVEHGDPDRDPIVWMRSVKYSNDSHEIFDERYFLVALSRTTKKRVIKRELFWDSFACTAAYWLDFEKEIAHLDIPEKQLETAVKGTLASLFVTFSGDHPHYGHCEYGRELHDNFPPTVITGIEASTIWGLNLRARRMLEHMLAHGFDKSGRFVYRQGALEANGASGTEYGQILWLINRFNDVWEPREWLSPYLNTVVMIGENLIKNRMESAEFKGAKLVKMCAEADTNGRIYDYIQNNLWAVRGLEALASFLEKYGCCGEKYKIEAEDLLKDVKSVIEETKVDSIYGPLVPFQLQYTVTPLTLSNCKKTFYPVDENSYRKYIIPSHIREDIKSDQDYLENTYANYRYYLEMLSSRLLEDDEEQALVKLREDLGGELLGMTRFLDRVDDWPVYNYARFLLETDRIDKYLMLLYSHTAYHGIPELMVYYEQFGIDGSMIAPDCVPSLLITALMTSWLFCFEPVAEDALYVLRAIPAKWYDSPSFSIKGVMTSCGSVDIYVKNEEATISIFMRLPEDIKNKTIYLDISGVNSVAQEDVIEGTDLISQISGTRIRFKKGISDVIKLVIKR